MDEYALSITVDDVNSLSPAVRRALDDLAAAIAADEGSADEVSGYGGASRIEIGTLSPGKTGPFVPPQPDNWRICLGFSWTDDTDPTCSVYFGT